MTTPERGAPRGLGSTGSSRSSSSAALRAQPSIRTRTEWSRRAPARLKSLQRVSLADGLIAATAIVRRAKLLHKDSDFERFAPELDQESLPYKTTSRRE